jgi:6-pyruvoyltetrahydropterin/6-carboxytetrahydropterin synthase
MYTARVEADFAAAHFLSHYHGKCENLHGHNYRVRLWVRGETLSDGGMLADFGILKKILRDICASLDHSNLNDMPVFANDPSAERIARYIFDQALGAFPGASLDPAQGERMAALLWAVDVYETPTSMARYSRE